MSVIEIDTDKVKAAAKSLRNNPPSEADVQADPQAFLAKFGVKIDADFSEQIRGKLASVKGGAVQSSAIHIDIP
jgi:hypothetical protein